MDSLTQLLLGAAVGEATLGRRVGRRAPAWGAVCGTVPDLDVFLPYADAVAAFTWHRSFSHSLLLLAAFTPVMVWLILKVHPDTRAARRGWAVLVYLAFATHVLLDSFTVYGTQILWPLSDTPVSWSTIFIIDPLYTVPLLAGVLGAVLVRRTRALGRGMNAAGLVLSTLYLAWSAGAKLYVHDQAEVALAAQGLPRGQVLTTPTPFNTVLWRVLSMAEDGYYEGYYSLLDARAEIRFARFQSAPDLLEGLGDDPSVQRLRWFTRGFYSVTRAGGAVLVTDLRMGLEPSYAFRFRVGQVHNPHAVPVPVARVPSERDASLLPWLWRRIRDAETPAPTGAAPAAGHLTDP